MSYFLFRSFYRWPVLGLLVGLAALWYYWYATDQIIGSDLLKYLTGITFLNLVLAYFSYPKSRYATLFLFSFSYILVITAAINLYLLSRGL